jgi:SNF family Na+-dependent transporter
LIAVTCAWIIVYLALAKGINVSGKISIFTVLAPYVMLAIMFARTLELEGSIIGLKKLFLPDFSELFKLKTWYYAIDQNFFQHNIGSGTVLLFSTFRSKNHAIFRSSILYFNKHSDCKFSDRNDRCRRNL